MNKISNVIKICAYEFRIQMLSKRVWMGYLLGIAVILHSSFSFYHYVDNYGETVNVLEAFVVAANNSSTFMFMMLGWLLAISEAPFINNNAQFLISRANRQSWNVAMLLYILVQGIIYYSLMAGPTIIFSVGRGFWENIWSKPLINLTENPYQSDITVYFPYASFIKGVSVFKAFAYTWILGILYCLFLGMVLYILSLCSNQVIGAAITFFIHFLGYEIMAEGLGIIIRYSLLARSLPVLQIGVDLGASIMETFLIFFLILGFLISVANRIIKYVDFKEMPEENGHNW